MYRVRLHANRGGGGGEGEPGSLDDERSYMYIYNIIADTDLGGETKNSAPRTCSKRGRENRRGIGTKKTSNRSVVCFLSARETGFLLFSTMHGSPSFFFLSLSLSFFSSR